MNFVLSNIVHEQNSIGNSVRVDYWEAELAIIDS